MADTWGGYASRLLEFHRDAHTPEQVLELLGITTVHLADPSFLFTQGAGYTFWDYEFDRKTAFREKAEALIKPEQERLRKILDAIMQGYVVKDAEHEANLIQEKVESHDGDDDSFAELLMKRDAFHSGVAIPAAEFGAIMLSANLVGSDSPSELAADWLGGVRAAIEDVEGAYRDNVDIPASHVTLGRDAFSLVNGAIGHAHKAFEVYVEEWWAEIEPAFVVKPSQTNPLLSGESDH